jgi:hypothetical protein
MRRFLTNLVVGIRRARPALRFEAATAQQGKKAARQFAVRAHA